jgi:hypothetical protein
MKRLIIIGIIFLYVIIYRYQVQEYNRINDIVKSMYLRDELL